MLHRYLILLLIPLVSCTHKPMPVPQPVFDTAISYQHLVYSTDTLQQSLDAYLPAGRDVQHTSVVVLIHGGSWVTGDKNDFNGLGLDTFFNNHGCAVVNMNYRLDNVYQYPAPIDDVGLVMDYIRIHASTWKINPNSVCLFGRSSGSQLALLYAYSRNADRRIKAVIDAFGPTNLVDSSVVYAPLDTNVTVLLGPYAFNQQKWYDASPVYYMAGAIPTVIMQGTLDQLVLPAQSKMLQDSLLNRGIPQLYFDWVGQGHGWNQQRWLECRDQAWDFVSRYL